MVASNQLNNQALFLTYGEGNNYMRSIYKILDIAGSVKVDVPQVTVTCSSRLLHIRYVTYASSGTKVLIRELDNMVLTVS